MRRSLKVIAACLAVWATESPVVRAEELKEPVPAAIVPLETEGVTSVQAIPEVGHAGPIYAPSVSPEIVLTGQQSVSSDGNETGPCDTDKHWWVVAPYAWAPGIKGTITSFGVARSVNIHTSDVIDHLGDVNGALQLHMEAGVERLGFIVDTNIIRLSQSTNLAAGSLDFDLQQTLVEVLGMYRLLQGSPEDLPNQTYSADFLLGGRYYNFTNGVTFTPFDPTLPLVPLSQSAAWVDLVAGVRGRAPLLSRLDAFARADVGGFGIGSSSKLAWNAIAGLDWRPFDHLSLLGGYRVLDIETTHGSGTNQFGFDAKMQGPFIALALQY